MFDVYCPRIDDQTICDEFLHSPKNNNIRNELTIKGTHDTSYYPTSESGLKKLDTLKLKYTINH